MKKILLSLILSILLSSMLAAQKVKWENDTVYKENSAYCLLKKSGGLETIFSIQNLEGKEIAVSSLDKDVKNENGYPFYRVTFLETAQVADFPNNINLGKKMAQALVDNEIFIGDSLNPSGVSRFLVLYPQKQSAQINNIIVYTGGNGNYTMVDRDRKGMIFVSGISIRQSNVEIGSYKEKSGAANEKTYKTVTFYLANGTQCADATVEGATSHSFTIHTLKDNSTHVVEVKNIARMKEELAQWLVENYYL